MVLSQYLSPKMVYNLIYPHLPLSTDPGAVFQKPRLQEILAFPMCGPQTPEGRSSALHPPDSLTVSTT